MKKQLFLLPILTISTLAMTGCQPDKRARLTYGTLVDTAAEEIVYGTLASKVARKESFLIAVYQDGLACGCWTTFKEAIDQYVDEYDTKIYYIASSQFSEGETNYGLTILRDTSDPTFALFKEGKKVNEYIYGKDTKPMFQTLSGLRKAVKRIAKDPQYFYVDQEYLDNALFTEKKEVVVHYIWHFCPDCNDCFPEVMIPYSNKNAFSRKVWIINLAIPGLLIDPSTNQINKNYQGYVDFLRDHNMSYSEENEPFGYDRGFVPTTQIWQNGKVKDMNVYFNDGVEKVEDQYVITRSYYSEERIQHLGYTNEVLQGKVLPAEEVDISVNQETGVESYSWKMDYARLYHKPIMEAFFNKYVK